VEGAGWSPPWEGAASPRDPSAPGAWAPHPAAAEFLSCAAWPGLGDIRGRS